MPDWKTSKPATEREKQHKKVTQTYKKKKERHRKPSIAKLELKRTIKETLSNKVYVKQVKRS